MENKWHFLLALIADDSDQVIYRPKMVKITGSINSAILLTKIVQLAVKNDYKPFTVYKEPIKSADYQKWTSREEMLWLSRKEYDTAIDKIWKKVDKWWTLDHDVYVRYYTDWTRKTRYKLNISKLAEDIAILYHEDVSKMLINAQISSPKVFEWDKPTKSQESSIYEDIHKIYMQISPKCRLTDKVKKSINTMKKEWITIAMFQEWVNTLKKLLYDKNDDWTKKYYRSHIYEFQPFVQRWLAKMLEVNLEWYLNQNDRQNNWTKRNNWVTNISGSKEHYSWTSTVL